MTEIEIQSGPFDVLASGTVIAFDKNPLRFTFGPAEERLTLILVFRDTEDENGQKLQAEVPEPNTLQLTLTNIGSQLGAGTINPLLAGSIAGRELFMHLRVYELQDSDKTLHYTFYLGKEVAEND